MLAALQAIPRDYPEDAPWPPVLERVERKKHLTDKELVAVLTELMPEWPDSSPTSLPELNELPEWPVERKRAS